MTISRRNFLIGTGTAALAAPGIAGMARGRDMVEFGSKRDPSLWSSEIAALPSQPQYQGHRSVDLAVVGGGFTGLACAYYAKRLRPDWSVLVLDSHKLGSGASSRNSGAVAPRYVGIDDPDMPHRGLKRLQSFIETEQVDCEFSPATNLRVLPTKSEGDQARVSLLPGESWIAPEELRDRAGTSYYAGGAVEDAKNYKVHPAKLVEGHIKAALRMGVELYEDSPVLDIKSAKPALLSTPGGEMVAKNVCIATNAYTPRLGFLNYKMFPLHQYTFATRKLRATEVQKLGLDRWDIRFEDVMLPVTFRLMPSGHFFVRMVLGYASHNSCDWQDVEGAKRLAMRLFEQRYTDIADIGLVHGWHGVTGHTPLLQPIAGPIGDGNIHVSVAYNGLGIMPGHNNGYLTACNIVGHADQDLRYLTGDKGLMPFPGDFYRSLMLKPFMSLMTPV
jgi:glycine/D-amino acid oxidase-like deaminating enzyme